MNYPRTVNLRYFAVIQYRLNINLNDVEGVSSPSHFVHPSVHACFRLAFSILPSLHFGLSNLHLFNFLKSCKKLNELLTNNLALLSLKYTGDVVAFDLQSAFCNFS